MTENSLGILLGNLCVGLLCAAVLALARWRGRPPGRFQPIGLYLILLPSNLVLWGGIDGDRYVALVTLVTSLVGIGFLIASPRQDSSRRKVS